MASAKLMSHGRDLIPLMFRTMIVFALLASIFAQSIFAQTTASDPGGSGDAFPDGITPSDVYSRLNLVNRCLDRLFAERNVAPPTSTPQMETRLGPLHVYQMVVGGSLRVQELSDQAGVLSVPTLSVKPRLYAPRDVRFVVDLILGGVRRIAEKYEIDDLPSDETPTDGKTPTEVFHEAGMVYLKLSFLCGYDDISPNEVYAEMVRAADDVRSVLRQTDLYSRYRVDAPQSEPARTPGDVFSKCLDIRKLLNQHRMAAGLPEVPLATPPRGYTIRPRDVFLQSQIIIAELNLLKLRTGTISSTPLAIPVKSSKQPTDVHQQANLIEYLLRQVKAGTDLSEEVTK